MYDLACNQSSFLFFIILITNLTKIVTWICISMIQIKKIDLGFENKLNNKQPTLPDYG